MACRTDGWGRPSFSLLPQPSAPFAFVCSLQRRKEIEKEKEKKEKEEREAAKRRLEENIPLSDPVAEKKRLEALQMKADLEAAADSLGVGTTKAAAAGGSLIGRDTKTLIEAVRLISTDDFKLLGTEAGKRVTTATGKSTTPAVNFFREVLREGSEKLSVDDLNGLITLLTVKVNEKRAALKAASGKGKGGTAKSSAKMHVERDDDYGSYAASSYDDYGDVDAPAAAKKPATGAAAPAVGGASGETAAAAPGGEDKASSSAPAWSAAALDGDFM